MDLKSNEPFLACEKRLELLVKQDGLPYVGEHKKYQNSYFVLGFGGNGITFSVTGMKMASDFLKGKSHPLSKYFKFGR